jgi:hypothetical protein
MSRYTRDETYQRKICGVCDRDHRQLYRLVIILEFLTLRSRSAGGWMSAKRELGNCRKQAETRQHDEHRRPSAAGRPSCAAPDTATSFILYLYAHIPLTLSSRA